MARFLRARFGSARRQDEALARSLSRGDAVELECRLRRTSARGWGQWTRGTVHLGALPDGGARWRTADPIAVGFPITRGPVDLPFVEVTQVQLRGVRFQTEAFYGMGGDIVIVVADHDTTEIALPAPLAVAAAARLDELLVGDGLDTDHGHR